MDPIRNPYAPGAGQPPPELAGREEELRRLAVALERAAAARTTRGLVLSGLRGVGKTVLLNAMRSQAMRRGWATGKLEVRTGVRLTAGIAQALNSAVRELSREASLEPRLSHFRKALRGFTLSAGLEGVRLAVDLDVDGGSGTADTGDLQTDLTELFIEAVRVAELAGTGIALFVDELQDAQHQELVALCGACHEMSQTQRPLLLIAAGLPTLPAVLSAARSYAERLFTYVEIDRLSPDAAEQAVVAPAEREGVRWSEEALQELARLADRYPYFLQAYGKATWDAAVRSPVTVGDVLAGRPEADHELAVGFFGSRFDRATRAERHYMLAMADLGGVGVPTSELAARLGRSPNSVSPIRDSLIKKGLVYSPCRGTLSFTVPRFSGYLQSRDL